MLSLIFTCNGLAISKQAGWGGAGAAPAVGPAKRRRPPRPGPAAARLAGVQAAQRAAARGSGRRSQGAQARPRPALSPRQAPPGLGVNTCHRGKAVMSVNTVIY